MPYPPGHSDEVRQKIIRSARKLFNRRGFEHVTVNQIMAAAGLTRGGFYSYFKSKEDLYVEVLDCFFTNPNWNNSWKGVNVDLKADKVGPQIVRAYLCTQHFEDIENSCPMITLPTDVARGGKNGRRAFETVFRAMLGLLERDVQQRGSLARSPPEQSPPCAWGAWSSPGQSMIARLRMRCAKLLSLWRSSWADGTKTAVLTRNYFRGSAWAYCDSMLVKGPQFANYR